jgi:hypothetical protein
MRRSALAARCFSSLHTHDAHWGPAGLVGGVLLTLTVAVVVILTAGTVVYLAQQFRANTYQVLVSSFLALPHPTGAR